MPPPPISCSPNRSAGASAAAGPPCDRARGRPGATTSPRWPPAGPRPARTPGCWLAGEPSPIFPPLNVGHRRFSGSSSLRRWSGSRPQSKESIGSTTGPDSMVWIEKVERLHPSMAVPGRPCSWSEYRGVGASLGRRLPFNCEDCQGLQRHRQSQICTFGPRVAVFPCPNVSQFFVVKGAGAVVTRYCTPQVNGT